MMAKVYDSTSPVAVAQDLALTNVVYRSYARSTAILSSVQSDISLHEISVPFTEGIIKRIILVKETEENLAQFSNITLSESSTNLPIYKICEYSQINFSESYLDSEEQIYYSSLENKIYAHVNVDGNFSTNLLLRLDIEKVN